MAEVDKKRKPLPTETGGIVSFQAKGADGNHYTFTGKGKLTRHTTQQQNPQTLAMEDVEYIEIVLVPDPNKHNATLPVRAAPPEGEDGKV